MAPDPVIPAEAASLVILRGAPEAPEVLLGKRRETARFMPGYYVYPGGAVDPQDQDAVTAGCAGTRFHLAAIRETWEETALTIADDGTVPWQSTDPFYERLLEAGQVPNAPALHYIARATTPPGSSIRFDTRFFLTFEACCTGTPEAIGELPEVLWVPVSQVMDSRKVRGVTKFVLGQALSLWQNPDLLNNPDRKIRALSYSGEFRLIKTQSQAEALC